MVSFKKFRLVSEELAYGTPFIQKKRGVTSLLSHLLTEDLVILLKFFDILDYFLR